MTETTETLLKSSLWSVQSTLQNPLAGVICVATAASRSFEQTQLPGTTVIPAHAGSVSIHCSMGLSPAWKCQVGVTKTLHHKARAAASSHILEKT